MWCTKHSEYQHNCTGCAADKTRTLVEQLSGQMTVQQKTLIERCATLRGEDAEEVLGGLMRMMLEPHMEFWHALEEVFRTRDAGMLPGTRTH